ncbi:MAG: TetR/AcrR family transcriptional regulator [Clostridia bacterium]|nr:TetR/AcrR family transcriptional regulator [Clostridia bacterium]
MQIKKEDLRTKLLDAAEKEFYMKGFEKASIRAIVKAAGTTTGNYYNYFESKEALFEALVLESDQAFHVMMDHEEAIDRPDDLWHTPDVHAWREQLKPFFKTLLPVFNRRFYLLIARSEGTKYAGRREVFNRFFAEHFIDHMARFNPDYPYAPMGTILAKQLVDGILNIIESADTIDAYEDIVIEFILFIAIGTMGILQRKELSHD